ncbi:uncharacterized protein LOC117785855 [Drosophila innubila]|uniref:uncharacterized protein LOC117785855 n=1 Tax=Drosophila innubila TaxID=198719 RepID=UPI00148B829D|nr:uncharacterized protein LOC117785855 [Drosophila innubila]
MIKAVNWNKATAIIDFYIESPVRNASMHVKFFKKDYSNKYQPFLIDVYFNICDVISRRKSIIYGNIIWKTMKRFTNVNHSCPIEGHVYSRDIYLDETYIPILPLGSYQLFMNYSETVHKQIEHLGTIAINFMAMEEFKAKKKKV